MRKRTSLENAFVKPEQLINISGLSSPSASEPADVEKLEDKFKGFTVESDNLPNVSISASSSVELPTKEDFSATWKNSQVNHQSADDSDDIFEENVIPKVSLKTPENTTALYPTYDESLESDNDGLEDELARQFAAQEQARMQEMEVRAKASNAEDALKVILMSRQLHQLKRVKFILRMQLKQPISRILIRLFIPHSNSQQINVKNQRHHYQVLDFT